jgi:hypothetical protein
MSTCPSPTTTPIDLDLDHDFDFGVQLLEDVCVVWTLHQNPNLFHECRTDLFTAPFFDTVGWTSEPVWFDLDWVYEVSVRSQTPLTPSGAFVLTKFIQRMVRLRSVYVDIPLIDPQAARRLVLNVPSVKIMNLGLPNAPVHYGCFTLGEKCHTFYLGAQSKLNPCTVLPRSLRVLDAGYSTIPSDCLFAFIRTVLGLEEEEEEAVVVEIKSKRTTLNVDTTQKLCELFAMAPSKTKTQFVLMFESFPTTKHTLELFNSPAVVGMNAVLKQKYWMEEITMRAMETGKLLILKTIIMDRKWRLSREGRAFYVFFAGFWRRFGRRSMENLQAWIQPF